jgi:radical SAM protein with 4Fe4S-binding SPASM domain
MKSKIPLGLLGKVLFRTPDLIPVVVSGLFGKHVRAEADYRRGDGRASRPPAMITLRITNACNHRCAICGQYGRHGYMNADTARDRLRVLPVERYIQLLDEVAEHKPVINITGGEPFLYPGLMELGRYAKKKGLTLFVTTNGVRLRECAAQIVADKWDVVLTSLDGPEEVHDACRNLRGAFKTAFEGLQALQECRRRAGAAKPYINTSTTLSATNVEHLRATFELGRTLRPDLMVLFLSWFTSEAIGQQQTAIMKLELGIEPQAWKSYVREFSSQEAAAFQDALIELKKSSWPFHYFIVPDVGDANYATYYLEPSNYFGYSRCAAPFLMTDVLANGDVVTCRDYVDVTVGNIQDTPLLEIWNGRRYVEYRQMMIRHRGVLPQCSRCCGLMGY